MKMVVQKEITIAEKKINIEIKNELTPEVWSKKEL